jgi:hypothetical protein
MTKGKCYDHMDKNTRVVQWVKCGERDPEKSGDYLVIAVGWYGYNRTRIAKFRSSITKKGEARRKWFLEKGEQPFTYWMSLPEFPEGEE